MLHRALPCPCPCPPLQNYRDNAAYVMGTYGPLAMYNTALNGG